MTPDDMRLEIERLKAQVKDARMRLTDVEIVADRLAMRLNHFEQDNLPTTPFNSIPLPLTDEIEVTLESE